MIGHAARVQDPIDHTYADAVGTVGMAISAVAAYYLGRLFGRGTGDKTDGAKMAITIVTVGTKWSIQGGKQIKGKNAGHITHGAATVGIGPKLPRAARILDKVACASPGVRVGSTIFPPLFALRNAVQDVMAIARWCKGMPIGPNDVAAGAHGGATIIDGAMTVRIERLLAARVGHQTSCGGTISKGCDSPGTVVWIGGPSARLKGAGASETAELDAILAVLGYVKVAIGFFGKSGELKMGFDLLLNTAKLGGKIWKDATGSVESKIFEAAVDLGDTRNAFAKAAMAKPGTAEAGEKLLKAQGKSSVIADRGTERALGGSSGPAYQYDPATDTSTPSGPGGG